MDSEELKITPFDEVLKAFRAGEIIIITDDEDRENEGDLVIATEKVNAESLAFMMREARGLICVSLSEERAKLLNLPLQVLNNNSPYNTPFTVTVDHISVADTGVSAEGRATTLKRLVADDATAEEFVVPGNVMPLIAHPLGVLGRRGQTEGSFDMARLAGFKASGIICEILNSDGSMARGAKLNQFAKNFNIKITTVNEILKFRAENEVLVRAVSESVVDSDYGQLKAIVFEDDVQGKEHLLLSYGEVNTDNPQGVLVRIHSECLTGDVFGSRRCDCGLQLSMAMEEIKKEGSGIVLYLRQEGRGIGLLNKLRAYELQDLGVDTVDANIKLGFEADQRDFVVAANMLRSIGINGVRLLTNNPRKLNTLKRMGIEVVKRIPVKTKTDEYSMSYLNTKREKLGHLLD